jgi:hypothetical protein
VSIGFHETGDLSSQGLLTELEDGNLAGLPGVGRPPIAYRRVRDWRDQLSVPRVRETSPEFQSRLLRMQLPRYALRRNGKGFLLSTNSRFVLSRGDRRRGTGPELALSD